MLACCPFACTFVCFFYLRVRLLFVCCLLALVLLFVACFRCLFDVACFFWFRLMLCLCLLRCMILLRLLCVSVSGFVCCSLFVSWFELFGFPLFLMFVRLSFAFCVTVLLVRCCLGCFYCLRLCLLFCVCVVLLFDCVFVLYVSLSSFVCVCCLFVCFRWLFFA